MELIYRKVLNGKGYSMKVRICLILFVIVMMFNSCKKEERQYTSDYDVIQSRHSTSANDYSMDIDVVVLKENIGDYQKCAYEIIEHCIENDFYTIMFSYDIKGYPNRITATVYYPDEEAARFRMTYESEDKSHNIKDNAEDYKMSIKIYN